MISYEDFLLNELVGLTGLDDEEISEILKKIGVARLFRTHTLNQK